MFLLERNELYIVKEPMTKNRSCQSYRWRQCALCESKEELQQIIDNSKKPEKYRITELPWLGG